jgi:hypothetical protein
LKNDNMEQTVLTLCILDPAQETEIWKRAYNIVLQNRWYQIVLKELVENITLIKEIEEWKKEWERLDKEIKEWKKEWER